jgi:hypothetical protein
MSEWIDRKYIGMLSHRLDRFAVKTTDPYLANFRCPICGDSQKNKWKARGYMFSKSGGLFYKCHNCNHSSSLGNLIKEVDPTMYKEYVMERFKDGGHTRKSHANVATVFDFKQPVFKKDPLKNICIPAKGTIAELYLQQRQVPKAWWDRLMFVENIQDLEKLDDKYKDRIVGTNGRLVIPFYNKNKDLVGITCRALANERLRYITIRLNEDEPMIFNLDQIHDGKVYVTEGPIDSMFLPNAVAVGNSDLQSIERVLPKENVVLVFDNQPRNDQLISQMQQAYEQGYKVVVWPKNIRGKDINEMVMIGLENVQKIIDNNTFEGLELLMKMGEWKRC